MIELTFNELEKFAISSFIILLIILLQFFFQTLFIKIVKISNNEILDDLQIGIILGTRIVSGLVIIYLIVILYRLDISIIVVISAIIGAIITLSSLQILNNIIAGIFIVILRPYNVQDFIAIGQYEGVVIKFNLNITKLLTIDNNYIIIQNRTIFRSELINFTYYKKKMIELDDRIDNLKDNFDFIKSKKYIKYSFQMSVPLNYYDSTKNKIVKVCNEFESIFLYKPYFFPISLGYKLDIQFVVLAKNGLTLISHIKNFRKSLIEAVY